ncbi:DNA primase [Ramlibacter sp.]|uniref:DNA primase n=1 Tax=Ramlibacter sp. TaxID=1917967 RepID=UPI003D0C456A
MAIPQSFLDGLLSRVDIVDVVGQHVELKKGGTNHAGLCPFHGEKSPSFTVTASKQFYHCFGCGKNGNAIGFLMDFAGMNFVDAVKDLAHRCGLQMPDDRATPADRERAAAVREKQVALTEVLERAAAAYRTQLRSAQPAIDYLRGRGISGEAARRFGLGFAPPGWRNLASVFPEYDSPLLGECGLVIVSEEDGRRYDRFRDRVMFPIRNVRGECVGFGGRVMGDEKPKYLNSPETAVFSKGRELYGLFEAREAIQAAGFVLVTEGYMDVVALAQLGFANAVATLGTACTAEHVQKLFRSTDNVVFSFDGDAAGQRAARKAMEGALPFATDVRSVRFLFLPAEHDPDSFIRAHGADAFGDRVKGATPLSRFLVDVAGEGCDLATAEGRARLAAAAKPLWSQLPAGALKHQLLAEIGRLVGLGAREILALWGVPLQAPGAAPARPRGAGLSAPPVAGSGTSPAETRLARLLQVLLVDSAAWESLSHDDQGLLCGQAGPYGALFTWLDSQVQDQGARPWSAVAEALRGHEHEALALLQVERGAGLDCDPDELEALLAGVRRSRVA